MKEAHILKKERDILKRLGKKRSGVERDLLKNFGLVILDEYHRYFKNVDPSEEECKIKSIYDNENERENLKLLFISATPYRANKSHIDMETMNEDDKKNITVLPTFEQFAQLFCGGRKSSKDSLDEKYLKELDENYKKFSEDYLNAADEEKRENLYSDVEKSKNDLQEFFKRRMVRHERTMLSKNRKPEKHTELFKIKLGDEFINKYKEPIRNMHKQYHQLRKAGYDKAALNWSLSMPWLLTFSTKNKTPKFFECLTPNNKKLHEDFEDLFLYENNGELKNGKLMKLPNCNVAFYQMCKSNLDINKKHDQLIWMPPTMPEYKVEKGIFATNSNYSKLIVFAEYRYLQRGGALLLSEYARIRKQTMKDEYYTKAEEAVKRGLSFKNNQNFLKIMNKYYPKSKDTDNYAGPGHETLDERLRLIEEWLPKEYSIDDKRKIALALIASPLACAHRIGMSYNVEDSFNNYFKKEYILDALVSWLIENKESFKNNKGIIDFELGILRYCAEGNLYRNGRLVRKESLMKCTLIRYYLMMKSWGRFMFRHWIHILAKKREFR